MAPRPIFLRCLAALAGATLVVSISVQARPDSLEEFFRSGDAWKELSDFSYSGYRYSEHPFPSPNGTTIEVSKFGAVPDDGLSDRNALQAAFDEAERLGGARIVFERGEYTLDAESGETESLTLYAGNTVLLGKGSAAGGTTLRMDHPLSPENPDRMYSTPFILNVQPRSISEKTLTRLESSAVRGGFQLEVADVSKLKAGDWVTLFLEDVAAVETFFEGRSVSELWTRLSERGIAVAERHRIERIDGTVVTFSEPLQVDVDAKFSWQLREYQALEEIGIEGIRFVGGWDEDFVHHRSARDDGAWSCLKLLNVRNAWIRDVAFENWNYALRLDNCSATSVLRVSLKGKPSHFGIHTRRGYGNLIGLVSDTTGNHHGPSVGYQSVSTVFWRYEGSPDSSFDSHSTGPYATLLDASSGGWMYGRAGGPLAGMPNHMGFLTVWNYERTGGKEPVFDFWRDDPRKRDRFLKPVIVGFHGVPTEFEASNLSVLESLGNPVDPESLFEAQLSHRIGKLPEFLEVEIELWKERSR